MCQVCLLANLNIKLSKQIFFQKKSLLELLRRLRLTTQLKYNICLTVTAPSYVERRWKIPSSNNPSTQTTAINTGPLAGRGLIKISWHCQVSL